MQRSASTAISRMGLGLAKKLDQKEGYRELHPLLASLCAWEHDASHLILSMHIYTKDVSHTLAARKTAGMRLCMSARLDKSCPVEGHEEVGARIWTSVHSVSCIAPAVFWRTLYMRFCRQVSLLLYTISCTPPFWPPVKMRPSGVVAMLIMGTLSVLQEYRGSACTTRFPTASPLWSGLRQMPSSTTCRRQQSCQTLLWPC